MLSLLPEADRSNVPPALRPRLADDPDLRAKVMLVAKARLLYGASIESLAAYYAVSDRTIRNWIARALAWEGQDAEALRRVVRSRK